MNGEQLATAHRMRTEDDASYADIAEHLGLERDDWQVVRDALKSYVPAQGPQTALDELEARAQVALSDEESDDPLVADARAQIEASKADRELSEAEWQQIERIYRTGAVSFKQMAEALDPPVHWLTVADGLGKRGWYRPDYKMATYSTATPEGAERFRRELAAGQIT